MIRATSHRRGPHTTRTCDTGNKFPVRLCQSKTGGSQRQTEVWFELVPSAQRHAMTTPLFACVPVDPDGEMSIVVHIAATDPHDWAGWPKASVLPGVVSAMGSD